MTATNERTSEIAEPLSFYDPRFVSDMGRLMLATDICAANTSKQSHDRQTVVALCRGNPSFLAAAVSFTDNAKQVHLIGAPQHVLADTALADPRWPQWQQTLEARSKLFSWDNSTPSGLDIAALSHSNNPWEFACQYGSEGLVSIMAVKNVWQRASELIIR